MKDARPLWVRMFDFGLEHKGFCTVGGGPDRHCNCGLSELRAELNAALASPPQIAQPEPRIHALEIAIANFQERRGKHEGDHDSAHTACSKCELAYIEAEQELDKAVER